MALVAAHAGGSPCFVNGRDGCPLIASLLTLCEYLSLFLSADSIYWSDFIVSSVEQAVARARVLNQPAITIPGASLYTTRTRIC
jgi:hypothetical protein